jgi:hypothetical protein
VELLVLKETSPVGGLACEPETETSQVAYPLVVMGSGEQETVVVVEEIPPNTSTS